MVWKWPINKAALVKGQLEMTVIPNTSNIRLIRIKRGQKPANYQVNHNKHRPLFIFLVLEGIGRIVPFPSQFLVIK